LCEGFVGSKMLSLSKPMSFKDAVKNNTSNPNDSIFLRLIFSILDHNKEVSMVEIIALKVTHFAFPISKRFDYLYIKWVFPSYIDII
jgi:hypothetical protein